MMLEDFLESLGHTVAATCDSVADALDGGREGRVRPRHPRRQSEGRERVAGGAAGCASRSVPFVIATRRPCRSAAARVRRRPGDREALYGRPGHSGDRRRIRGIGSSFRSSPRSPRPSRCIAMLDFQSSLIFPTHAVARCRAAAARRRADRDRRRRTATRCTGVHIPPAAPQARANADPRLRRQCLERRGRRRPTSTRSIPKPTSSPSIIAAIGRRPARRRPRRCSPTRRWSTISRSTGSSRRGRSRSVSASAAGSPRSLAADRPLDGLILVTPFDSLKAVGPGGYYPWLPIGPFFQHEIDAAAALQKQQGAGRDHRRRARRPRSCPRAPTRFARAVGNLVFDRTIAGAGHNDIYVRSDFQRRDAASACDVSANDDGSLAAGLPRPIHILEIQAAIAARGGVKTPAELIVR